MLQTKNTNSFFIIFCSFSGQIYVKSLLIFDSPYACLSFPKHPKEMSVKGIVRPFFFLTRTRCVMHTVFTMFLIYFQK